MICEGCGNSEAHRLRFYEGGICICERCGLTGSSTLHDVFWDGKPEINLADDPHTGKPRVFSCKSEKARYLRERGIMEAGDKVNGAPVSHLNVPRRTDPKHEVRTILKRIKEMGRDNRRQEYLKIVKEGQRAQRQ